MVEAVEIDTYLLVLVLMEGVKWFFNKKELFNQSLKENFFNSLRK